MMNGQSLGIVHKKHIAQFMVLLIPLLAGCKKTENTHEADIAINCKQLQGVWFSDITVDSDRLGLKRDIIRAERNPDGSLRVAGFALYIDRKDSEQWELSGTWNCEEEIYREYSMWGETEFKVTSTSENHINYYDHKNNFGARSPIYFTETKTLTADDSLKKYPGALKHLGL